MVRLCVAVLLSAVSVSALADHGKETRVKLDEVPAAVREVVASAIGSGKIEKIEKEEKKDAVVYEFRIEVSGGEYALEVSEQGKILEKEIKELAVKLEECPAAVQEALKKAAEGGEIVEVAMAEKHDVVVYEADIKVDGKVKEVKVDGDGKPVVKKQEAKEEEDKEDKKD